MPLKFPQPPLGAATDVAVFHCPFIIDAPTAGELRVRQNVKVVVSRDGRIQAIDPNHEADKSTTANKTCVIVPGFVDCHVHAPQYKQLGTKTDVPLMEWLQKYTFPAEAAFASTAHASAVYPRLICRLLRNGTTTALYFASNHLAASLILAETCAKYGQRALVGKTCSDQLLPEDYVETTAGSLADTEVFVKSVYERHGRNGLVMPVVTPRFVPTCSLELLQGLGEIAEKYSCHIQTHAAESVDQVALVRSQHPELARDIAILASCKLLTSKTVLAHCTHLHDSEARTMAQTGAAIASCPYSNMLFSRAVLPVNRFRSLGVKIGLGTDIAGGHSASMVDSVRMAGLVSRIDGFLPRWDRSTDPREESGVQPVGDEEVVDWKTAFYLSTRGGAQALGLEVGVFEVGMRWDAVMVDLTWDEDDSADDTPRENEEDVEMKFERWICSHGGEQGVKKVWVDGKTVFARE
ncbi:hypothetical protein BZA05DRAFT_398133 [Tricharina praecox]|uniref:uncharacterized protein n=1 Tax=Tricharina praecox TaxID=43433 RepID=UPI00221E96E9|nr:uncharacterized protein BZA05DRAFT_398133 [Tricharina praecox]KAI5851880.1 hypothetical protein BZA05DRAFT_398133 [Tricharina praecox]